MADKTSGFDIELKEPVDAHGVQLGKLDFGVPRAKHMKYFFSAIDMQTKMPGPRFQDEMAKLMADVGKNGLSPEQFLDLAIDDFMNVATRLTDFFGAAGKS